ncbi:MAG: GHKL domain-containing protein [Defluviitaleaceae bacterium]|nr:GHKL domain-containing protein [Defluviitaleaceae bacterium]
MIRLVKVEGGGVMDYLNYIGVALGLLCIVIALIVLINVVMESKIRSKMNRYFMAYILCSIGFIAADITARLAMGHSGQYAFWLHRGANFIFFVLGPFFVGFLTLYLLAYIERNIQVTQKIKYAVLSLCTLAFILYIVAEFTDVFYFIDAYNIYQRGSLYWVPQIPLALGLIINMGVVMFYRRELVQLTMLFFIIYIALPILALIAQTLFSDITFVNIAISLNMMIIYIRIQAEQGSIDRMDKERIAAENAALEMQNRLAKYSYENIMVHLHQVGELKHEMGKHLAAMQMYLKDGRYGDAKQYLNEVGAKAEIVTEAVHHNHFLINAVLHDLLYKAKERGIKVELKLNAEPAGISDPDLYSLLNNILDNAMEACDAMPPNHERFIRFAISRQEPYFVISCTNSRNGEVIQKPKENGLQTTKQEEGHGYGLLIIEKIAEAYDGLVDTGYDEGTFRIKVALIDRK